MLKIKTRGENGRQADKIEERVYPAKPVILPYFTRGV